MSGTRSHFPKAPATDALIVAHGQPSDPEPAEAALAELTLRVQAYLPELRVQSATLANGDAFEHGLKTLRPDGLVYPLFMANGWFVRTELRRRIDNFPCRVLAPLGMDPDLPALAIDMIDGALAAQGLAQEETAILLAAHGSAHGQAAADSARAFANRLRDIRPTLQVSPGFVEQAPFLPDMVSEIAAPCLCLPFFAMDGDHMKQDVRQDLVHAGFSGGILPALGQAKGIPKLIATALIKKHTEREAA
ncbi:sirohydrochlorin chelatase [Shimia sediminis]|uniref:sirohydrochlorin chelatase n=1 Tax=Shimia sediminis TaxID=2497945 RepID=UPI000F8E4A61|nr:CbiX/SirB N-terminal domain-containing protein [Shimia sediminis]